MCFLDTSNDTNDGMDDYITNTRMLMILTFEDYYFFKYLYRQLTLLFMIFLKF